MARVLVTGGAGYIGCHAVRALADAGHAVAVLDNLSAGHAGSVPSGVPLVECDMHDTPRVVAALETHFETRLYEHLGLPRGSDLSERFLERTAEEWERWADERGLPIVAVRDLD